MKLISGKPEIIYLLSKVIEKYEHESGSMLAKNSNRKNYEPIARLLSEISNRLPFTAETLQHEKYSTDYNPTGTEYPFRKYDITGNQIKDAYFNQIVSNPRPFLVEACYIYLYDKGRKGFGLNPCDQNLLLTQVPLYSVGNHSTSALDGLSQQTNQPTLIRTNRILASLALGLVILTLFLCYSWQKSEKAWQEIKKDLKILPYHPTQAEIDSLEGIWLCYTGSPQARISDPNRYHMVVPNVVDIKYKNGYFMISRFGANFDHEGFAQFESPWLVSLFTHVQNKNNRVESPRHSLMYLNKEKKYLSVISASWNFDVGKNNSIIGIREVYVKQGKGGRIEEIINTVENASCICKIIRWYKQDNSTQEFRLKNQLLDSLTESELKSLLDERSILLRVPTNGLVLGEGKHNAAGLE